jgi:hypothetical protein
MSQIIREPGKYRIVCPSGHHRTITGDLDALLDTVRDHIDDDKSINISRHQNWAPNHFKVIGPIVMHGKTKTPWVALWGALPGQGQSMLWYWRKKDFLQIPMVDKETMGY